MLACIVLFFLMLVKVLLGDNCWYCVDFCPDLWYHGSIKYVLCRCGPRFKRSLFEEGDVKDQRPAFPEEDVSAFV
jgi:hypothetical protein